MDTLTTLNYTEEMNRLGATRRPFLFLIDFEAKRPLIFPLDELNGDEVRFAFPSHSNVEAQPLPLPFQVKLEKYPVTFETYRRAFDTVMRHIHEGNSFLVNLTQPTPIACNLDLAQIFAHSRAPYRLWYRDQFTVFSPETFVRIQNNNIYAYPMKGTISSSIPNAGDIILSDVKEMSEHVTIVDLIRNDLSCFAQKVEVSRFRYLGEVPTQEGKLLQVSSEIFGYLPVDFHKQLGDIISSLLPAGSISGAPKPKTLEIIREAEGYERGYYTGVMGVYDGQNLDSAVMIRFIEQQNGQLVYKSGGGITARSNAQKEYQELIDKVYVPLA
ncbi:MAG: aminodeoxychorismate synthase component I [Cyclobacteriaceae bacterium]